MKGTELQKKVNDKIEELAKLTDKAKFSDEVLNYLKTIAKFHNYSLYNQWLIAWQCPHAEQVAGYQTWLKQFNRQVKRGEKAIQILAPMIKTLVDEETGKKNKKLVGFKSVNVFDISQTEGEPIEELNVWKTRDKLPELESALIAYAKKLNLKVKVDNAYLGGAEGCITSGSEIYLKAEAGTKTLAHEIAHYLAGHLEDNKKSHKSRELEAESVAFVVCEFFGLQDSKCPNYLTLTGVTADDLRESFTIIQELSKKMINAVEAELTQN